MIDLIDAAQAWVSAMRSTATLSDLELACLHAHEHSTREQRDGAFIALHARQISTAKLHDHSGVELLP